MSSNQLSGSIPAELGNLSNLSNLILNFNQLTGSIPPELGNLTNLFGLYLGFNQLTGSIPRELGDLTNLRTLYLSSNQLSGSIPPEIGDLTNLEYLYLNDNQLTGSILPELGDLANLQSLSLDSNQLSGSIPFEIGNLTSLLKLGLSDNNLVGDVPASFINLINLCVPDDYGYPCFNEYGLNLGYNRLNVPAPEPPKAFLDIKDPDWYLTQAVEEAIPGGTGGTIISNDGNTEIVIPSGIDVGTVTFIFAPQPYANHPIENLLSAGNNFELTAMIGETPIISFEQPLMLTFHYTDEQIGLILEDTLTLYYWDGENLTWVDAVTTCSNGEYTRNPEQNLLTLPICHLSEFALMGGLMNEPGWITYLPLINR